MDLVGGLLLDQFVAEALQLIFDRDVGDMGGDAQALWQPLDLTKTLGLRHRIRRNIAHRDVAALGDKLARQFAAHACAAPGNDRNLSGKILHGVRSPFCSPVSDRPPVSMFTWQRAATQAASYVLAAGSWRH